MKCSLLLVQEREAKIFAPVWEVAARAAADHPLPPRMSFVLHGKFDCKMRFNFNDLSCLIFSLYIFLLYPMSICFIRNRFHKLCLYFIFSCFAPKVPFDRNYFLICSPIQSSALQITATLLATAGENMSFPSKF